MKHVLATLTATALATGVALTTTLMATAAPAAHPTVRTYVANETFNLDGFGDSQGWYHHNAFTFKVVLSPHIAWYYRDLERGFTAKGKALTTTEVTYLVGTHTYDKKNGARNWTIAALTPAQLRTQIKEQSPTFEINTFYSIPGVTLVGPGHYHVTCTVAQVSAFWQHFLNINTRNSLVVNRFKKVTVDLWNDSNGHLVKVSVTGKSTDVRVNLLLTFSHYNQPLTIKAPVS